MTHNAPANLCSVRKIVYIDEAKCNGCGECVPSCAEGAIKIINGKARLVAENLCDGLGACLGRCPMDAIRVEERAAEAFDHHAVQAHLEQPAATNPAPSFTPVAAHSGCPGSRMRIFDAPEPGKPAANSNPAASLLRQWPVQLALLPAQGSLWQNADVLLAADCVPFACSDFHSRFLAGKTLAIACPKLDNAPAYVTKLAEIFANNPIRSITIARMEVPCCYGLVRIVQMALEQAGKQDLLVKEIVVTTRGEIKQ